MNGITDSQKILLEVVQKLSLAKDLETIMLIVRHSARKLTQADGASFVLRDNNQCYYADEDAIAPLWKGKRFPMDQCVSGWVMKNCCPVLIEDIFKDARVPLEAYRPTFVKSLAIVPIRTLNPIGAIGTYWAEFHKPTEDQINLLQGLADSTSIAMENVNLQSQLMKGSKENLEQMEITKKLREVNRNLEFTLKELNLRNEEMLLLKEFSSSLQTCVKIEEAYKLIGQYANKLLADLNGIFYSMHSSRNYLEAVISWGDTVAEEKIIKPEECLALRRGSIYKSENPKIDLICAHCKLEDKLQAYSCIPLFAQSDVIGLLYLEWSNYEKNNPLFIERKKKQDIIASMIAEQIAIGISNLKLRETLHHLSFLDPLTNIYNRRYLEETLEREISRVARQSINLAIFMLDIDHFKLFNDKYGHEAGDLIIQALSSILRNFARREDIAARYGGEEFILVLPGISLHDAKKRAQELHEKINTINLQYGGKTLAKITASIGLSLYPTHGKNKHDLIAAADKALYRAKKSGRNKTVVFDA